MPAPTNISKGTATVIDSLPYTITQTANDDGGTTQDLWFTRTAAAGETVWGAYALGDGSYTPETILVFADDTEFILGTPNTPIQFAPTAGTQYWINCHNISGNHSPADLTFSLELGPTLTARVGDIFIPDDQTEGSGFPGTIIDPTTGVVRLFVAPCPNGEAGDILPSSGTMLLQNVGDVGTTSPSMKLLSGTFVEQVDIPYTYVPGEINRPLCRLSDESGFYFGDNTSANTWKVQFVSAFGVVSTKDTITSTANISAFCPNPANTILYLTGKTGSTDSAIRTWDLAAHSYGADLVAAISGYLAPSDIRVLSNGNLVVNYQKNTTTRDLLIKVYDNTGTVIASKSFGSNILTGISRLFYAVNDPNEIWLRRINVGNTLSYFRLSTVDLSTVNTFDTQSFQEGVNVSTGEPSLDRFGSSITCAAMVIRSAVASTTTTRIRRLRQFNLPSSQDNHQMFMANFQVLAKTGIGLIPDGSGTPVQGQDPQVMISISRDGGQTWSPEKWVSAGVMGKFLTRIRWIGANGKYRNGVMRFVVDDPVDWNFVSAMADIQEGSS